MKKIYKFLLLAIVSAGMISLNSCETIELEKLVDPNQLAEGDSQFLFNSIQNSYRGAQVTFNDRSSELTRIDFMAGTDYFSNYNSATLNGPWNTLYSTINPDIAAMEALETPDNDLSYVIGASKIMQAHVMMQLVDYLGDIPWTEANQPDTFPTPVLDDDASVYAAALALLDEGIARLNSASVPVSNVTDLFYGALGSSSQTAAQVTNWVKVANTLKMRAAITTGDMATFNSIAANDANYISSTADDFQFNFGTQLAPVNTQHQDYQNDYTTSGANIYQNNWLMYTMVNLDDPRMRYYFYRQKNCVPGASCQPDGQTDVLQCSTDGVPPHIQGTESENWWCYLENGYWGRMHANPRGIPPDGNERVAVGVYPAAGLFDDDDFSDVTLGLGGNGAGIEPFILASYVDFWKAEVALSPGGAGAAVAATNIQAGLEKSIAKVQTFISVDPGATASFAPTAADNTAYVAGVVADFTAATGADQWNILAEQYWITMFGGGADAFNFYRRTGFPTTVGLGFGPALGNFPRTFLYPQNEVIANPNIMQRTNNDDAVFWNTQPLPIAN